MTRVGITGQSGFIGNHLYNYLGLFKDQIKRIEFRDEFFENEGQIVEFVKQCDVIVHLAAMNRHSDLTVLYETNLELVKKLISATENANKFPHIVFSSSTQEQMENLYGRSKKEGRMLFELWAVKHGARFTGFVIPNVFGPFGKPRYNSVVATFSHQLTHEEVPEIQIDGTLKLIYINDLVNYFFKAITGEIHETNFEVPYSSEKKVSEIIDLLNIYKDLYFTRNIFPKLNTHFEVSLFNTFRTFIDNVHYPVKLDKKIDQRGYLVENIKEYTGGQSFFSLTKPGITRGNHFHTKKLERFCVVQGTGVIKLRRIGTSQIIEYQVSGEEPSTVDMPVWHTHSITNTGSVDMLTLFWTNEMFDPNNPDTYFESVE